MKDQSAATHPRLRRTVKFQVQSGNTLPRPFGLGPDFSFSVAAGSSKKFADVQKNNDLSPELRTWIAPWRPRPVDRVAHFRVEEEEARNLKLVGGDKMN